MTDSVKLTRQEVVAARRAANSASYTVTERNFGWEDRVLEVTLAAAITEVLALRKRACPHCGEILSKEFLSALKDKAE